jgi:hypothetical protein
MPSAAPASRWTLILARPHSTCRRAQQPIEARTPARAADRVLVDDRHVSAETPARAADRGPGALPPATPISGVLCVVVSPSCQKGFASRAVPVPTAVNASGKAKISEPGPSAAPARGIFTATFPTHLRSAFQCLSVNGVWSRPNLAVVIADPLETRQADLSGLPRSIWISPKVEPVDTGVAGSEVRRLRISAGSPLLPARPRIVNPIQSFLGWTCRK